MSNQTSINADGQKRGSCSGAAQLKRYNRGGRAVNRAEASKNCQRYIIQQPLSLSLSLSLWLEIDQPEIENS